MADFTLKQHDTAPPLDATLSDQVGALNLTGATVKLILKTKGTTPVVTTKTCTLVDATAGKVRATWAASDTASVTTYDGEFEITWPNATISTVPNEGYISIAVLADLG